MNSHHPPVFFGEWVKKRRKALDLTQEELAQQAGCSVFALRKIESGERRPSKQLAECLAKSLQVPSEEIRNFIRVARGELNFERLPVPVQEPAAFSISELYSTSPPQTIPIQPTPLVGREAELAAMEKLFNDTQCRLLTLTGMGGIGKTRLAIEFAAKQCSRFPGGVYYIPLASINSADAMIPAIADGIGYIFSGPTEPKEQLLGYIINQLGQPMLLVLDNLEHLLVPVGMEEDDGAIGLISIFLEYLPNVKVLTTSRERLNLRGEWTYELYGLPVPPVGFTGSLDDYSAACLFLQSIRRMRVDFEVTPVDQAAIIKICHLLDGIPLAIELAAAWVGILSCEEIAQEIHSNIDFLTTSMRDVPDRHRSMRASFDHSWNLLSKEEQGVLCRLAVFYGGFDRMAAEQVAGATLPVLALLVTKSLVHRMDNGRYDLHEVIRQNTLTYLASSRIYHETRDRHINYYLKFIAGFEKALKSSSQQETLRVITDELENIRSAWFNAIEQERYASLRQAIRSLAWFFEATGLMDEGIDHFQPLITALKGRSPKPETSAVLGHAMAQQGLLFFRKGQFDHARTLFVESIAILRSIDDPSLLTDPLVFLGIIFHLDGEYDQANATIAEGLKSAQAGNERWFEAYALYNLGYIDSLQGNFETGYEKMMAGLNTWREVGDPHSIALGLHFLTPTLIQLERFNEASECAQESIQLCKQAKNRWGLGNAYRYYGLVMLAQGKAAEASAYFRKSLEVFENFVTGWDVAFTLTCLGDAKMLESDLPEAKKLYLKALKLSMEAKATPVTMEVFLGLADLLFRTGETGLGRLLPEYVWQNPASKWETKERARKFLARLQAESEDPPDKLDLFKSGQIPLEEVADLVLNRMN